MSFLFNPGVLGRQTPGGEKVDIPTETVGLLDYDRLTGDADSIPYKNDLVSKPAHLEGLTFYDPVEKAIVAYNDEPDVTPQLGQEGLLRVYNNTGAAILNGRAVYISGSEGVEGRPTIALARADVEATARVVGLATHDIEDGTFGYVTLWGHVNSLDTSMYSAGAVLYLSSTTAGGLETSPPGSGSFQLIVAYVLRSDALKGRLIVTLIEAGLSATPYIYEMSLFATPNQYVDTNSATYVSAARFIFPGTSALTGAPDQSRMVVSGGIDGSSAGYRIQDITNALTIAEVASTIVNTVPSILDLGTISNLPVGVSIFEIQFKKNSGGAARMSFVSFRKS